MDLMILLALSNTPIDFKDDPKSSAYVKECLKFIDIQYSGEKSYAINKDLSLKYYSSI